MGINCDRRKLGNKVSFIINSKYFIMILTFGLRFIWKKTNTFFGESQATIVWNIPLDIQQGHYRIRHFGHSKNIMQQIKSYTGVIEIFSMLILFN